MHTYKIAVGSYQLAAPLDVSIPQEYAAYHQTVRVAPGVYPVYAFVAWSDGGYRVRDLAARSEGITTAAYYGRCTDDRVGKPSEAWIHLPTYGRVADGNGRLADATLLPVIVRTEWDTRDHDPESDRGFMWRLEWPRGRASCAGSR